MKTREFCAVFAVAATVWGWCAGTALADVYTWSGGGADNNWTTSANWGREEGYPNASDAQVEFTGDATVTVDSTYTVSNMTAAASTTVTLQRSGNTNGKIAGLGVLGLEDTTGDKFVLDGVNLESVALAAGDSVSWYADIEIAANAAVTNTIYCNNKDNASSIAHVDLRGNLTGGGNLQLARNGHTSSGNYDGRGGVSLYGNNEAFAGTCTIRSGSSTRGPATFCSATAGSALARWVYPDSIEANTSARAGAIDGVSGSTVKFGAYEGKSYILGCSGSNTGNTLELGALNTDFSCSFSARSSTAERANNNVTLRKVGTGTMIFGNEAGNPCINTYEMNGGTLKFANEYILRSATSSSSYINPAYKFTGGIAEFDPACTNSAGALIDISPYIADSTAAIKVMTQSDQTLEWSSALASSNTNGLWKIGAGTLVLGAVPKYSGMTWVENGTLKVPAGTSFESLKLGGGVLQVDASASGDDALLLEFALAGDSEPVSTANFRILDADSAEIEYTALDIDGDGLMEVYRASSAVWDSYHVWTGNGSDSLWTNADNWANADGTAASSAPTGGTIIFPSSLGSAEVTMDAVYKYEVNIVIGCEVVLTSSKMGTSHSDYNLLLSGLNGDGILRLGNVFLQTPTSEPVSLNSRIEVLDGYAVQFYLRGNSGRFNFTKAVSGSGDLNLSGDGNSNKSFTFSGSLAGFSGKISALSSTNVSYYFEGTDSSIELGDAELSIAADATVTCDEVSTVKIGRLTGAGKLRNRYVEDEIVLEIGCDGEDAESSASLTYEEGMAAWTVKKTGTNTQALTGVEGVCDLSLEGGALQLPAGAEWGAVAVGGGKFIFAVPNGWDDGEAHTLFSCASGVEAGTLSADNVSLDMSALDKTWLPVYDNTSANVLKVTLEAAEFVWNGGESGYWDDAANWLMNGAATDAAPTADNTVKISAATVFAVPEVAAALVDATLEDGAKIAVLFSDSALSFEIPSGMTADDFTAAGPYETSSDGTTVTATRTASMFVWSGAVSASWTDVGNWTVNDMPTAVLPGSSDTAKFTTDAEVEFDASADLTLAAVTVDAAVTLTGDGTHYLRAQTFDGSGTLTLGANACLGSAGATTMSVALVVTGSGDDKVKFKLYNTENWEISSTITGTGDLYCDSTSINGKGFLFSGNTQDFEGTVTCTAGESNRSTSCIYGANAGGAKSAWEFHTSSATGSSGQSFISAGAGSLAEAYYFGALNGYVRLDTEAVSSAFRIVIGGREEDSVISGSLYRTASYNADSRPIVRKVGTSRLTLNAEPSKLEIVDGKVELAGGVRTSLKFVDDSDDETIPVLVLPEGSSVDPAAKIIGSDAPIAFDSEGHDYTWAGVIPASNTGGFVKLGEGTLKLSAAPKYSGVTFVKGGTLAVPLAAEITTAPGTILAYSDATYKYYTRGEGAFLDPEALVADKCEVTIDNLVYTNGTLVSYSSSYPITYFGENYPLGLWATNVTITVTPGSGYKNAKVSVNGVEHASPVEYAVNEADIAKGTLAITGLVEKIVYVATTLDLGEGLTFIDFSYGGETYASAEALAAAEIDCDEVTGDKQLTVSVSLDATHEITSVYGLALASSADGVYTYNVMSTALTSTATITTRSLLTWTVTAPKVAHATIALTASEASAPPTEDDDKIVYTFLDGAAVSVKYTADAGYYLVGTAVFSWEKISANQTIDPPSASAAAIVIGDVGYGTISEAVANLSDGATLTITSDDAFADDAVLTISGKTGVTVDLSGAEYSSAKIVATESATVTVKNGTINATSAESAAAVADDHATLKLEKVTITTDAPIGVGAADEAALEIDEDTVITASGEGAVGVWMEGGGTLKVAGEVTAADGTGVIQWGGVATTVKATANVSAKYAAVEVRGGSLTVENGATLTTTGSETSGEVIWNEPAKYSAKVFVVTDTVPGIGTSTLLIPAALKEYVKTDNLYSDSQTYTVDEISKELTAALSAIPLSASTAPSSVSVKTKAGLSYGIVAVADLSELAGATPENWTEGDGSEQEITVPQVSGDAVFYRLVATPTAEVE